MVMQRRNDQNVVSCAHAKAQREWNEIVIVAQQCPTLQINFPTIVEGVRF
jgi:hypothetical protein